MLKALIVDDEPLARDELAYLLKRSKGIEIIASVDTIERALEEVHSNTLDVVFLDIQLADESGLDLAKKIQNLDHQPAIVFATAFDEYALNAFELQAIDYILKPYDEDRIIKTVKKITKLASHRVNESLHKKQKRHLKQDKLAITVEERILLVTFEEILYVYTLDGKTVVVTGKYSYQVNEPLVSIERKLQDTSFIRVHRSYIVNIDMIIEIQPWFHSTYNLIMQDHEKVPVSRTYTKELRLLFDF